MKLDETFHITATAMNFIRQPNAIIVLKFFIKKSSYHLHKRYHMVQSHMIDHIFCQVRIIYGTLNQHIIYRNETLINASIFCL